jgi:hypothetical protein
MMLPEAASGDSRCDPAMNFHSLCQTGALGNVRKQSFRCGSPCEKILRVHYIEKAGWPRV